MESFRAGGSAGAPGSRGRSSYFYPMPANEKIVMGLILFGGFLWLRMRARSMDLAARKGSVVFGIFGVLTALLIAGRALFDHWRSGPLVLKAALLAGCFAAVGFLFLRPSPPASAEADADAPPRDDP